MDSKTLAKKIAAYDAGKKSSADILNQAMSQYGVPEIRTRVAGLRTTLSNTESALNNVDPSVTGRTSRSLVTEAQRSRMVNNERAPIAEQYGSQSRALGVESSNLTDQQSAANTLAQGQINDYTIGRQALQSQYEAATGREAAARAKAESDRAYKLRLQENAQAAREAAANRAASRSSGGGSKSSGPTPVQQVSSALSSKTGSDGYVSPGTWQTLKNMWVSGGYGNAKQYDNQFAGFRNPKNKYYKLG